MSLTGLLASFFIGGLECSTHRIPSGQRLDMVAATAHDLHAAADYDRLAQYEIRTVREGIRWHLIERTPLKYDFGSLLPLVRAAPGSAFTGYLGYLPLWVARRPGCV
jgi:hypothetical protein